MTATLRRGLLTVAAFALIGLVAAALVGVGMAIGAGSRTPASPLAGVVVDPAGAADPALATELDAMLAADQTAAPAAAGSTRINAAVAGLRRLAAARRLVHGTIVVDLPRLGGLTTVQLDHGTISAVGAASVTIAEAGGTTATVSLGDETRVRKGAAKAKIADLKVGDEAFALSKVESGGAEAYLVVVPAR